MSNTTSIRTSAAERPILFKPDMVRAILDGKKTVTRRLVKPQPEVRPDLLPTEPGVQRYVLGVRTGLGTHRWFGSTNFIDEYCKYKVGDRLWVRETWAETDAATGGPIVAYRAGGAHYIGRTEGRGDHLLDQLSDDDCYDVDTWRPSIFMPRWASRLTLEITDIRVERLQAITEADARAEGFEAGTVWRSVDMGRYEPESDYAARDVFEDAWKRMHGVKSWESNPWVWVITFTAG